MLTKEQKREMSQELRDHLAGVTTLFLLDNRGLKVNDVTTLRSEVRKSSGTYKVVKNSVAKMAVEGTEMEAIAPFLSGPKVLKGFIKQHPELSFERAFLEGKVFEAADAEKIADLPSKEELVARLLMLLQSPIRRLAVALNAPLQQLASVVNQIADKTGTQES